MIVVATTDQEIPAVVERLAELGMADAEVTVARRSARRLVLVATDDVWSAQRVTAALRADGHIAVTRPDGGAQLAAWRRDTEPITFGDRLAVCLAWSEQDRGALPPVVELGLGGFGNGQHPTTAMLIDELISRIHGGERVLDVGCGSGVLGLCALQLGAAQLVAMDMKATAVEATVRNATLNDMDRRVQAVLPPLGDIEGTFDVIVANVGRSAIVELATPLVERLAPAGWLAVTGFSPAQCDLVGGFLTPLVEVDRRSTGEWAAMVFADPTGVQA